MISPTGLRHSFDVADGVAAGAAELGCGFGAGAVGGVLESSIETSVFETNKPHGERPQDRHAEVHEACGTKMKVKLEADQDLASDHGENQAQDNAHHPCGKIGAKNVNRWRMTVNSAATARQHQCGKESHR